MPRAKSQLKDLVTPQSALDLSGTVLFPLPVGIDVWKLVAGFLAVVLGLGLLPGVQALSRVTHPTKEISGDSKPLPAEDPKQEVAVPVRFEANQGQWDPAVLFKATQGEHTLHLTSNGAVSALPRPPEEGSSEAPDGASTIDVFRMGFLGANPSPRVDGVDALPGTVNYFVGDDPSKWRSGVPSFAKVTYRNLYPGVDLVFHTDKGSLEYDFIVAPGADPNAIGLVLQGAEQVKVGDSGDLVFFVGGRQLGQPRPTVFQDIDGRRRSVPGSFVVDPQGRVRFSLGDYDRTRPLVIDPTIDYSTYLGGSQADKAYSVKVDNAGDAYVTGETASNATTDRFPVTPGAYQRELRGGDAFVAKLSPERQLVYLTYLGGTGQEVGHGIDLDSAGNAYVTGWTNSNNFPTEKPFQAQAAQSPGSTSGNHDAFVTKLDPFGVSLVYSSYLGGSAADRAHAIAVDGSGAAYVAGQSDLATGMVASGNPLGAFVGKINPAGACGVTGQSGQPLELGSPCFKVLSGTTGARDVALGADGVPYVAGSGSKDSTTSGKFGASDPSGTNGAFVAKLNPADLSKVYSALVRNASGEGIAVDAGGNAYLTGAARPNSIGETGPGFPTKNAFQSSPRGASEAFATKLNSSGTDLIYSTYLGGASGDVGYDIAVDREANAYLTGQTQSDNFPTANSDERAFSDNGNPVFGPAFVTKLDQAGWMEHRSSWPNRKPPTYSMFLGGESGATGHGIDVVGEAAYVTGFTRSSNFPRTDGGRRYEGGEDAFLTRIWPEIPPPPPPPPPPPERPPEPPLPPAPEFEKRPRPPLGFRPGDLDPTFNPTCDGGEQFCRGQLRHAIPVGRPDSVRAHAVAVQPDSKIVSVGASRLSRQQKFAVVRHHPDGSLDKTFGEDGIVTTAVPGSRVADPGSVLGRANYSRAFALAIQPGDGKIVVGGCTTSGLTTSQCGNEGDRLASGQWALTRYNTNGSLDDGGPSDSTPGDAFGTAGTVTADLFNDKDAVVYGLAIEPDGQIVAAGYADGKPVAEDLVPPQTFRNFALARFNRDGTLDQGFGVQGRVVTDFARGASDIARAVAVQPGDGKIVVTGDSAPLNTGLSTIDFALARYLPDGKLDLSCSAGPCLVTTDMGASDGANAMALQPEGNTSKIVLAGHSRRQSGAAQISDFALARYRPDLSLDTSFNGDGKQKTSFESEDWARANGVAVQPDGMIVAAGVLATAPNARHMVALARYNRDGNLDDTFDEDGKVVDELEDRLGDENTFYTQAVAFQADAKIVVAGAVAKRAGYENRLNSERVALARYNPSGTRDLTFGKKGVVVTVILLRTRVSANEVAIQNDGKILMAGSAGTYVALARYHPDGGFDEDFNPCEEDEERHQDACDGMAAVQLPPWNCPSGAESDAECDRTPVAISSMVLQPDGRIVVAGARYAGKLEVVAMRFRRDGSVDEEFGQNGIATASARCAAVGTAVGIQPSGDDFNIVVAGYAQGGICGFDRNSEQPFSSVLVRFTRDGARDGDFGTGGSGVVEVYPRHGWSELHPTSLEVYPSGAGPLAGRIVVGASLSNGAFSHNGVMAVQRYNPNGRVDESFGDKGMATADWPLARPDVVNDIALQADGKVVAVGSSGDAGPQNNPIIHFVVARFDASGQRDLSFNSCTAGQQPVGPPDHGMGGPGDDPHQEVEKGLPCGGINATTFESEGYAWSSPTSTVIEADGKIVLAGVAMHFFGIPPDFVWALARFTKDGLLDVGCGGFGSDGKVVTRWGVGTGQGPLSELGLPLELPAVPGALGLVTGGSSGAAAFSMTLQPNGRIVVGGFSELQVALARYFGGGYTCGFSVGDISVTEPPVGQTRDARFTVYFEADFPAPASVGYRLMDGSAKLGADYEAPPGGAVAFAPGENTKAVTVKILGDEEVEPDEDFFLELVGAAVVEGTARATISDATFAARGGGERSRDSVTEGERQSGNLQHEHGGQTAAAVPVQPAPAAAAAPLPLAPPAPAYLSQWQFQGQAQQQAQAQQQLQHQLQQQHQMQQQLQQQAQAQQQLQAQAGAMIEKERQIQMEQARAQGTLGGSPEGHLASGRSPGPSPTVVASFGMLMALGFGWAWRRRLDRPSRPFAHQSSCSWSGDHGCI